MWAKAGTDLEAIFEKYFRNRLGSNADRVWDVCRKYCKHNMIDQFELIEKAIASGKISQCVSELEMIWSDIENGHMPIRSKMTWEQETKLANSFLISDLLVK